MGFLSGKDGHFYVEGIPLRVTRWKVMPKGEKLDFTNSESGGYGEYLGGIKDLDFELDFDYFVADPAFGAMFDTLVPGEIVETITLYMGSDVGSPFWSFNALIVDADVGSPVRGKIGGTLRGCSTGVYTTPVT